MWNNKLPFVDQVQGSHHPGDVYHHEGRRAQDARLPGCRQGDHCRPVLLHVQSLAEIVHWDGKERTECCYSPKSDCPRWEAWEISEQYCRQWHARITRDASLSTRQLCHRSLRRGPVQPLQQGFCSRHQDEPLVFTTTQQQPRPHGLHLGFWLHVCILTSPWNWYSLHTQQQHQLLPDTTLDGILFNPSWAASCFNVLCSPQRVKCGASCWRLHGVVWTWSHLASKLISFFWGRVWYGLQTVSLLGDGWWWWY